jgi:hypothetical protein
LIPHQHCGKNHEQQFFQSFDLPHEKFNLHTGGQIMGIINSILLIIIALLWGVVGLVILSDARKDKE